MRLLHLSDPHFGTKSGTIVSSMHHFVRHPAGDPDPLALAKIVTSDPTLTDLDAIVISGDIGWSCKPSDYDVALQAMGVLHTAWPTTPIVVVPGNHDVDLSSGIDMVNRQDAFNKFVDTLYSSGMPGVTFPFIAKPSDHGLTQREALLTVTYVADRLLIVGVNSSAYQDDKSWPIAISPTVLGELARHIDSLNVSNDALRIFVLHHHLLPFAETAWDDTYDVTKVIETPDPTMVSNSARIQSWLAEHRFNVALHGHKHSQHGREDRLWIGQTDAPARRLVLVGAGSCGVTKKHRQHMEPLSYNLIEASPLPGNEWRIRVKAKKVDELRTPAAGVPWFNYSATAGRESRATSARFLATNMADCHTEISENCEPDQRIRNFYSFVDSSEYQHPATVRIGDTRPSRADVERSFRSLHPEYSSSTGWSDRDAVESRLSGRRIRIEHGSRMFERLSNDRTPLDTAIDRLRGRDSWAYLGLYRPEADTVEEPLPLPGLMGVQLVPDTDQNRLDIVATFRNLELSFWWVVNMLEMRSILEYACDKPLGRQFVPGSVTMFSAIATWKPDPGPIYTAAVDDFDQADFAALAVRLSGGGVDAMSELFRLLAEKSQILNINNADSGGLRSLSAALQGVIIGDCANAREIAQIKSAVDSAVTYLNRADKHSDNVTIAREYLSSGIGVLSGLIGPPT